MAERRPRPPAGRAAAPAPAALPARGAAWARGAARALRGPAPARGAAWAAVLALGAATPAGAHGGALLLERDAGRYAVALNASVPPREGGGAVDYTVTLRRDGRPDERATVRLRVRTERGGWSRPYAAARATNTYEVMLAQPSRDAWRRWDVRIELDGPGGRAQLDHRAGERPAAPRAPVVPLALSLAALVALAAAALAARRRAARRRAARRRAL